ncbi:crotonase/enoyl-CoA hydratase family protein [Rhodococcus sp. NPDC057529]|uniref:crotonase/enoyl-CoA hydratase family protein n=1 Tax=Rhodococcus sp. NPDC057529 TaxID=3346158 RepID=UPI00366B2B75
MSDKVLTRRHGRVLSIVINRPQVRNAIDTETSEGIAAALMQLDGDSTLAAGVISGAGTGFCAGMDLKAFLAGERPAVEGRGFAGIVQSPPEKPLVAAIEGHALAGGFEIALCCDLLVASESAVFGLPEVRRGLMAGGGGLLRLPRRVPHNMAMEWILTGRHVGAAEAERWGLVNRLVPDGTALDEALRLAETIAENGPLALRGSKQVVEQSGDWSASEAFTRQQEIYEPVRSSADAQEGARAFKEKRSPRWTGQ